MTTPTRTPAIVELANPAALAWYLKSNPDMHVTWIRGAYTLLLSFRGPDGRWTTTTITNPAFEVGDMKAATARTKAREFLAAGENTSDTELDGGS